MLWRDYIENLVKIHFFFKNAFLYSSKEHQIWSNDLKNTGNITTHWVMFLVLGITIMVIQRKYIVLGITILVIQ